MKTIKTGLVYFALTFSCLMSVYAQAHYESILVKGPYQLSTTIDKTIIRSCSNGHAISYHYEDTNTKYLAHIDYSGFYATPAATFPIKHTIPINEFTINDMKANNGIVVFCGYTGNYPSTTGIIGYFNEHDFTNNTNINITYYTFLINNLKISGINKLVVYNIDNINNKVVAIATISNNTDTTYGHEYWSNAILEIDDITNITSTSCHYAEITNNYNYINDIVATSDFVTFLTASNNYGNIQLRKAKKNSILGNGLIDQTHEYPSPYESNALVYGVALDNDSIAIAYIHLLPNSDGTTLRLRMFDLNTMVNFNSQEMYVLEKYEPCELIYSSNLRMITLLMPQKYNYITTENTFVRLYPHFTSTYSSTQFYHPSHYFQSLDTLKIENLISCERNFWYMQKDNALWQTSQFCPNVEEIKVLNIENLNNNSDSDPLIPFPASPISTPPSYPITGENGDIDCYIINYEDRN